MLTKDGKHCSSYEMKQTAVYVSANSCTFQPCEWKLFTLATNCCVIGIFLPVENVIKSFDENIAILVEICRWGILFLFLVIVFNWFNWYIKYIGVNSSKRL